MAAERLTADVAVVGGGIHGCSAALHLASRGLSVVVLEKNHVARHASGVNAGGVRRLGRATAEVPLAVAAARYWADIRALVDDDCGYRESRYLKVAFDDDALEEARRRVAILRQQGFEHEEVIGPEETRAYLPAAAPGIRGALHVPGDGAAQPFRTTQAFRRRAEALGARIMEGVPVTGIERRGAGWQVESPELDVSAGALVNAAGAWGGRVAALLGDAIPLEAHGPMLAVTAPMPHFVAPVVGLLGGALSLKQAPNGSVVIGGGVRGRACRETGQTRLDLPAAAGFLATSRRVFPHLATARISRLWAGIEGYTPDGLPALGAGSEAGVVHAFGFSAHGFQLAPAAGAVVADLVEGRAPALDIAAFDPHRFAPPHTAATRRSA